ncbi:helix-turn-helix domain-containing protein [Pseudobacteroides cellulosolvens]|uniref:Uncharacterized protein n=1 Tax=Pseudobacteroides cellulosolvens ATCC 35603 = DSM 2933 TaxID=398512 RepID=A0A0L6JXQ5_9FIRM|nr:helix-turn-helix transcriptional regulator [Pseudobacteroides cellulosolvens]KNY30207.1 hypothetical protein Bccel_5484 [Pseudobacteroides cellulosolvens ATCC 35603 = DSM 2933]
MRTVVHYSNLKQLMAKYGMTISDISQIVGKSYRQTIKILNKEKMQSGTIPVFNVNEASKIVIYFHKLGEASVTLDELFFDQVETV